jgi:hypothetical protein
MRELARDVGSDRVALNGPQEIIIYLVTLAVMLWPLAANGAPFYTPDSASYLRGGRFGFETASFLLQHWWQGLAGLTSAASTAAGDPKAIIVDAVSQAGGIRSPIYSVMTFILRGPANSLLALTIAQTAAVAALVCSLRRVIAPKLALWAALGVGAAVAFLTSAAWYAAYAMPDIFAGMILSAGVVLTAFFDRIGKIVRIALVLLLALCITVHGSHLPLAFTVLGAGAIAHQWLHRPPVPNAVGRALWFFSPVMLAVAAMLGTSYVAFGEASLAPKRYPIQLARSVADGPGAWYLRDHCKTERYAICEIYGSNPPRSVREFLWSRNGVRYRATPDQMERIRAEESVIVRRAAMEYPVAQLKRSATNIIRQLFDFGTDDLVFGGKIVGRDDPSVMKVSADRPALKLAGEAIIYISFAASIVFLLLIRRRLTAHEAAAVLVCGLGLAANAAVCGILSGVTDRYQGRVAWVLPAVAIIIWFRVQADRNAAGGFQSVRPGPTD